MLLCGSWNVEFALALQKETYDFRLAECNQAALEEARRRLTMQCPPSTKIEAWMSRFELIQMIPDVGLTEHAHGTQATYARTYGGAISLFPLDTLSLSKERDFGNLLHYCAKTLVAGACISITDWTEVRSRLRV